MKRVLPLLILPVAFLSCEKRKAEKQAQEDETIIQAYIAEHNLDAVATGSGLYYVMDVVGSGSSCNIGSTVRVAYTGSYTDGSVFDQSDTSGVTFPLANVIEGWREGIPYFREGGSGMLLIPSALGYGPNGVPGAIPPNAVLIFQVELKEVL